MSNNPLNQLNFFYEIMTAWCIEARRRGEDKPFFYVGIDAKDDEGITVTEAPLSGPFARKADAVNAVEGLRVSYPGAKVCQMNLYA